jgi:glycosyltransferase involved in cell wall biosynthesis
MIVMENRTITAVVLTKNEEKNLAACLDHLKWVDDLVVLDSGSTDATLYLAKEYRARVFVNAAEKFIIADQRNWALDHCGIKTAWVLFVDADEIITEKLAEQVRRAVAGAPPDVAAFQLCVKFMFLGRWLKRTCRFPSWHDRLVCFGRARFKGEVWECFDTQGKVGRIEEPYLHYAFNNGMDVWIARHQRYAEWKASETLKQRAGGGMSFSEMVRKIFLGDRRERGRVLELFAGQCLAISPALRFIQYYFVRRGFLDGRAGFIYARMMATYQFLIYLNVLEKERRKNRLEF